MQAIKEGDRIFINGGSGGIGTFTIQMAKIFGASLIVTSCSGPNIFLIILLYFNQVYKFDVIEM